MRNLCGPTARDGFLDVKMENSKTEFPNKTKIEEKIGSGAASLLAIAIEFLQIC
jgi:hypothetical protein